MSRMQLSARLLKKIFVITFNKKMDRSAIEAANKMFATQRAQAALKKTSPKQISPKRISPKLTLTKKISPSRKSPKKTKKPAAKSYTCVCTKCEAH
jgi:hypothetical protein